MSNSFHNLPELARKGGFSLCDGGDDRSNTIDWRFIGEILSFFFYSVLSLFRRLEESFQIKGYKLEGQWKNYYVPCNFF